MNSVVNSTQDTLRHMQTQLGGEPDYLLGRPSIQTRGLFDALDNVTTSNDWKQVAQKGTRGQVLKKEGNAARA